MGNDNIFDVMEALGNPFGIQNQVCRDETHCLLLRADITPYPDILAFKIDLPDVEPFLKAIGPDPSLFTLVEARQVIHCPEWAPDLVM